MNINAKTQQVLEERVDRQRVEIMQAGAIVESVVAAMNPGSWPAEQPGYPFALRAVVAMLERATEQLDSAILFDLSGAETEPQS